MSSAMNWNDKPEIRKGSLGERIMWDLIKKMNVIPYRPVFDGPHPIDIFMVSRDMEHVGIADSKAKARRTAYPDTGIDIRSYNKYLQIAKQFNLDDVLLYFVDECYGIVYGNTIRALDKTKAIYHNHKVRMYPIEEYGIRFWPINIMVPLYELSSEECAELKNLSTRNPAYIYPEALDKYSDFAIEPIIILGNVKLENIFI